MFLLTCATVENIVQLFKMPRQTMYRNNALNWAIIKLPDTSVA